MRNAVKPRVLVEPHSILVLYLFLDVRSGGYSREEVIPGHLVSRAI